MSKIGLIVVADEPALFFRSVEEAERWVEWIDVCDGVYGPIFGPNGELFRIWEDDEHVHIAPEPVPAQPEALRALLTRFLSGLAQDVAPDEPLEQLLLRCEKSV